MRQNPYLAHCFGAVLDESNECGEYQAEASLHHFSHSGHAACRKSDSQRGVTPMEELHLSQEMPHLHPTQDSRVWQESAVLSSKTCMPLQETRMTLQNGMQQSPSAGLGLSNLQSPPQEWPQFQSDSTAPTSIAAVERIHGSTIESTIEAAPGVASGWRNRIEGTRLVIAQARELLDRELPYLHSELSENVTRICSVSTDTAVSSLATCSAPSSIATTGEGGCERAFMACNGTVPVVTYSELPGEGVTVASENYDEVAHLSNTTSVRSPLKRGSQETTGKDTGFVQLVRKDVDSPRASLDMESLTEAKCVLLSLNPDVAGCVAKRLTRRPPARMLFQEKGHLVVPSGLRPLQEVGNIPGRTAEQPTVVPHTTTAEQPAANKRDDGKHMKAKGRRRRDKPLTVATLESLLEKLANVMQSRPPLEKGTDMDILETPEDVQQDLSTSRLCGVRDFSDGQQKKPAPKQLMPPPRVVLGNAPIIATVVAPEEDHFASYGRVSTSELPVVNVGLNGMSQRRVSNVRHSGSSRAVRAPSYARPTESWLCKGVLLSDLHDMAPGVL
uniref:Uncharacterized protein n=1 Tax=Trypanosoma vivax (strain Y486) TaxID=1055687 RepID=G0U2R7_TRYVY|nr:conserved hypothetical protein [Trypanosoma vivax Y486]